MAVIPIQDVFKRLPHRFPFLLIDRVLEVSPGKGLVALKNVTCNEQFFQGHFPDWKIMPGVLMIEAIAQAGAIYLSQTLPDWDRKFAVLSKVDKAKFKRMVVPGDQLRIEADFIKMKGKICHMRGRALVDGELAAEADIFASVLDREDVVPK
jgi:beta-hydroxyacyl-ACP dehydratase FabZ